MIEAGDEKYSETSQKFYNEGKIIGDQITDLSLSRLKTIWRYLWTLGRLVQTYGEI